MKNVLLIYYTQSGQLEEIANNVLQNIENQSNVSLYRYEIKPKPSYPFPWTPHTFYDVFPETFLQIPITIEPPDQELLEINFDLIILAYQVWYLTPSLPVTSFLKTQFAFEILKDKPVITVIGCRNMWIQAQEKMKRLLAKNKARLVGNIVLVDRHINHISVITIEKWMMRGKKERYLGVFPKPGVSQQDIDSAVKFGKPIVNSLLSEEYNVLQEQLLAKKAVVVKPFLITMDARANVIFNKWANYIHKKCANNPKKRKKYIGLFSFYLKFAIWVMAPIVFIVFLLTYLPNKNNIKLNIKYYKSIKLR
ncbi:MAG: dialkylresorcinol condensing enzyme DarA [Flavobacteriales bacterium]|nr:MAG: dialkylresorcinol condensing enzyme DarA [Flavobacteriales bacterium]PIE49006.1 MAG: dialkylresorcinol condensing enzyme DarA [Flavobacteriales bacterium]